MDYCNHSELESITISKIQNEMLSFLDKSEHNLSSNIFKIQSLAAQFIGKFKTQNFILEFFKLNFSVKNSEFLKIV